MRDLHNARSATAEDWYVALVGVGVLVGAVVLTDERYQHWFMVPLWSSGTLVAVDAVRWMRRRLDLFDPRGIIGLFGIHFFFVAPLLHVAWDYWLWWGYWPAVVAPPRDWRPYLGAMAALNTVGLLCYRWIAGRPLRTHRSATYWRIVPSRFYLLSGVFLLGSLVAQVIVYASLGGVAGYVERYSQGPEAFAGMGMIFALSESFPILALFVFAHYARGNKLGRVWVVIVGFLLFFVVAKLFFGGLRGSRSNTIWGIFWALGVIHFWVRPVPRKLIIAGLPVFFLFLYLYGFYKSMGADALDVVTTDDARVAAAEATGRTVETTLLADLGRADVQAFLLYMADHPRGNFEPAWGRTYVGAVALLIPRSVWPGRPDTKIREGTNLVFGRYAYERTEWRSSKIYGLAGEALLNFGQAAVPIAFIFFGFVVARVRRIPDSLVADDARMLMYPFLVNCCLVLLTSDSDNLVFVLVKNGLIPLVVVLASIRVERHR